MADATKKHNAVSEAKLALVQHMIKSVGALDERIAELQLQLANVNLYIAKNIFRREIGLPPEPLTDEGLRGKGRKL
ncbi:MAG: hypothetical protein WA152_00560 [Microgenomates group bacterium]